MSFTILNSRLKNGRHLSSPTSEKKSADSCIEPEELCEHDA